MSNYSPFKEPSTGSQSNASSPSHAQWLRRQFSRDDSEIEQWPDLLIDRRPLQERKQSGLFGSTPGNRPGGIERTNLVCISQLVVKNVVDTSLRTGRQLDSDNLPLHQLFIVLDLCLRHGLKSGRRLLGAKKEVWDVVQVVALLEGGVEATDITVTARELSTVKTGAGRARAWLRLAMMQKKLSDYIKLLVEDRQALQEFYEPEALLLNEEGVMLAGLLVSLNIVDCNLCLKDEDLDGQQGVIDLTYYLRRKEDIGRVESEESLDESKTLTSVIDQKNYIEEINRNLSSNVANLQAKVDKLSNTNALMKEDLAITKRKVETIEQENKSLNMEIERQQNLLNVSKAMKTETERFKESESEGTPVPEDNVKLELEKELRLEVQMKAEMEVAMKLLEKDVHEKQDTIVNLRSQLEDIKGINLEMYTKLAECEKSLNYKSDMIQRLETKTIAMGDTLQQLDKKYVENENAKHSLKSTVEDLKLKLGKEEAKVASLEDDVKIERGWRERLQESSMGDRERLGSMRQELEFLKQVSQDYEGLRLENNRLRETVKEGERTLSEVGGELSSKVLELESLREEQGLNSWEEDSKVTTCRSCEANFGLKKRKHHCRNCGGIFCDACSDNKMKLASSKSPVRVCDNCYTLLLDRQSKVL